MRNSISPPHAKKNISQLVLVFTNRSLSWTFCRCAWHKCAYSEICTLRIAVTAFPEIFSILIVFSSRCYSLHITLISLTSLMNSSTPMSFSPLSCGIHPNASLALSSDCVKRSGTGTNARKMARQPWHESGRAGTKDPRGRPTKLGRLVGWGRVPPDLQGDAGAHRARMLW